MIFHFISFLFSFTDANDPSDRLIQYLLYGWNSSQVGFKLNDIHMIQ